MNHKGLVENPARLEFDHVSIGYNGTKILDNVTFDVPHGAQIAVVGPNGAGKSSLFKAMVGLLPIQQGSIYIHGQPLGQHRDCVAYIPQREEVDFRFPITVKDVVTMGRYGKFGWLSRVGQKDRDIVQKSMQQLGIFDLAEHSISELSGGQQQRVFLARALAQEPHLLLMDEPFTGIDATTQEITLNLLAALKERKVTILVSTHDLNMASERFERILLLNHRVIAYGTAQETFTADNISAAFGAKLLYLNGAVIVDECCPGDEHT